VAPESVTKGEAVDKLRMLVCLMGSVFITVALFKMLPYILAWRFSRMITIW
jgi:hypothetical protein